ncbi:MAG: hypothetical protein HY243_08575 [Proteobacteria bacterium]|nr:hypothetical protein [Pseudomonadota bacterium]
MPKHRRMMALRSALVAAAVMVAIDTHGALPGIAATRSTAIHYTDHGEPPASDPSPNPRPPDVPAVSDLRGYLDDDTPWKHGPLTALKKGQKASTPRILTIDYKRLLERYDDPSIVGDAAQMARDKLSRALWPLLRQLVSENGGTLLLDRRMFLTEVQGADITDLAIKRVDAAYPPPRPAPAIADQLQRPMVPEPLMLVADVRKLNEVAHTVYGEQIGLPISKALYTVMQSFDYPQFRPADAPISMLARRDSPRHMTMLPGAGSLARAR